MFIVGADIGQAHDPTALAVIETADDTVQVRYLERLPLGTPYPQVVGRITAVVGGLPGADLVVDATGVGRPNVDQIRAAGLDLIAVTITAGKEPTFKDGMWYVPKRVLVGALVAALENDRLQIASSLRDAAALVGELQAFRRQVTGAGRAAYGAETGAHDDLVVAVALAVWCVPAPPDGPWWTAVNPVPAKSRAAAGVSKAMGLRAGTPDFVMCWKGRLVGVELKVDGGRLSPAQREAHDAITLAGGIVTTCSSLDDVAAFLATLGVPSRARAP